MEKNIIRLVETNFAEITKLLIKTFPGANKRVLTNSNEIKILVAFSPHLVKKRKKERKKKKKKIRVSRGVVTPSKLYLCVHKYSPIREHGGGGGGGEAGSSPRGGDIG